MHPPFQEGERPKHKTGFLGLVGEKVDSIDTYKKELEEAEAKCAEISKAVLKGEGTEDAPLRGAAFVTFKRARAAALAAQAQHTKDPYVWCVRFLKSVMFVLLRLNPRRRLSRSSSQAAAAAATTSASAPIRKQRRR